ncbi:MAG: dipeptidase PepE [Nanoarchaeota archaeon]
MSIDMLLVSNTKVHGGKPFDHAREQIKELLGNVRAVTFIPYARPDGISHEKFTEVLAPTFQSMGYDLECISEQDPRGTVRSADAIFIGGGNTWHLLRQLKDKGLLYDIRRKVQNGTPYLGSSAGSNVAGLTIGNTNDMPAADCHGLDALGLVPFNVNPHYQDSLSLTPEEMTAVLEIAPQLAIILKHQGETRDGRIREYHALGNTQPVVAMREGAMLRRTDSELTPQGKTGGRIYLIDHEPRNLQPGENLNFLLK